MAVNSFVKQQISKKETNRVVQSVVDMAPLNDLKAIWPSVSGLCISLRHTLNSNFAQFNFKCRLKSVCLIDCTWPSSELVENVIET